MDNDHRYLRALGVRLPPEIVRTVVGRFVGGDSQYEVYGKKQLLSKGATRRLWGLWVEGRLKRFEPGQREDRECGEDLCSEPQYTRTGEGFPALADPALSVYRDGHWGGLARLAGVFRGDLALPPASQLFLYPLPRSLAAARRASARRPGADSISVWMEAGQLMASLRAELDGRFAYLMAHLTLDFPELAGFGEWKGRLVALIEVCHRLSHEMFNRGMVRGATQLLPRFVFETVMGADQGGAPPVPELEVRLEEGRLLHLVPRGRPEWPLAYEPGRKTAQIPTLAALVGALVTEYLRDERVAGLRGEREKLSYGAAAFQQALSLAAQRGTFSGTCDVCRPWYAPANGDA